MVRLDVNYRGKKSIKNTNIWRLTNMLLNNQQITEEIKKEIKICIETNENENTTTQNLWDSVKAVLRERFIAILEKAMATHSNTLAWKIPWMEEPGGLQSTGLQSVGHN